jgi:predicted HTH domain antitoxin/5-methylcytosine-specific restriction endonuclease McrA
MRPVEIDEVKLRDLYVNDTWTAKACAAELGVSQSALVRRLRKLNIEVRPPTKNHATDVSAEQVVDLYCNQKLSIEKAAKVLGRSTKVVQKRLRDAGIPIRSLSESQKLGKGTAGIADEQLIYLHDVRRWSCAKISEYFDKSPDFVRQRFIMMGKERRDKIGKNNPAYIDGRTPLRTRIRDCAKSLEWKQACMERDNYICQETGQHGGKLEVHHIRHFTEIFEEFMSLNSDLDPEKDCDLLFDLSQKYDPFWDISNGKTLSEESHHTLHSS